MGMEMELEKYNGLFMIFFAVMMIVVPVLFIIAYKTAENREK